MDMRIDNVCLIVSRSEKYVKDAAQQPRIMKLCEIFMHGVYYAFLFDLMLVVLIPVFMPSSPDQWTSLLLTPQQQRSVVNLAPCVIAWAYFMYVYITNSFVIIFSVFVSLFGNLEILKQCR